MRPYKLKMQNGKPHKESITQNILRVAREWGDINKRKKVKDGIYWFDCSSHGGYVVTDYYRNVTIPQEEEPYINFEKAGVKIYIFEEDTEWAILEWFNRDIAYWSWTRQDWLPMFYEENPTFEAYLDKTVKECLLRWNKQYIPEK